MDANHLHTSGMPLLSKKCLGAITLLFCLLSAEVLHAAASAGRVQAPFLKIPMGTRATGMGEAFTSIADDDQAMYYNPGGLAQIDHGLASFMHLQGFGGINYEYAAFIAPSGLLGMGIPGSFGLSYALQVVEATQLTKALPDGSFDFSQLGKNQDWTAGGSTLGLGWGWMANKRLGVGVAVKVINQQIEELSYSLVGVDAGAIVHFGVPGLTGGVSVNDIGSEAEAPLPSKIRIGLGYTSHFSNNGGHFIASVDAATPIGPSDERSKFYGGSELGFAMGASQKVALRGGYRFPNDLDSLAGLTAGAGYGLRISRTWVMLDYSYTPFGVLGEAHRMGLTTTFGLGGEKEEPTPIPPEVATQIEMKAPMILKVIPGNRQAKVFWSDPSGQEVAGYNCYLAYKPNGPWYKLNKAAIPDLEQVVGSLYNSVTTWFVVTAVGPDGRESKKSNAVPGKPGLDKSIDGPRLGTASPGLGDGPGQLPPLP